MPIWFELMVLLLVTYSAGIAIGWAIWGRSPAETNSESEEETTP